VLPALLDSLLEAQNGGVARRLRRLGFRAHG
jgi:hypothetical protein